MKLTLAVAAVTAILLLLLVHRQRRRRPPRTTRTCVTCDNLGTSELCGQCNGSGQHWVERPRPPGGKR